MDIFSFLTTVKSALKRHGLIASAAFISASLGSILYLIVTPPQYESSARITVQEGEETISDLGRELTRLDSPGDGADPLATQLELITSKSVLNQAIQKIKTENPAASLKVGDLAEDLQVKIIPATNILELNYSNSNPEIAADVLNAIVESTVETNGQAIQKQASTVRKFLEEQLPKQEARLARAEAAESKFRREHSLVSVDEQLKELVINLRQIENEERQLVGQLQEIRQRVSSLQQVTESNDYLAVAPLTQDLKSQLINSKIEYQSLSQRLSVIQSDKARLEARLAEIPTLSEKLASLTRQRESAEEALQNIKRNLEEAQLAEAQLVSNIRIIGEASVPSEPTKPSKPAVLVLGLATGLLLALTSVVLLEALDNRLHSAEEGEELLGVPILGKLPSCSLEVIHPQDLDDFLNNPNLVVPYHALIKSLEYHLTSATASGKTVIADFGYDWYLLMIAKLLNDKYLRLLCFYFYTLIQQRLNNPNLVVPYHALIKSLEHHLTSTTVSQKTKVATASNGKVRDVIDTFSSRSRAKTIVVSSAFLGEGKSLVVRQLAAVAAMLNQRTLVVDSDLNYGFQSRFFDLDNCFGLTDVIQERIEFTEACYQTQFQNLSVLPRGYLTNRPSTIIESFSMESFLETAATYYDWIILDASPITVSSNPITLSQYTEGMCLVVRPDFQSKYELKRVTSDFQQSGGMILGLIFNEAGVPKLELDYRETNDDQMQTSLSKSHDVQLKTKEKPDAQKAKDLPRGG